VPEDQEEIRPEPVRNGNGTYAPGQSGNPGGRPAGRVSFKALAREMLARNEHEKARELTERWIERALEEGGRDMQWLLQLFDDLGAKQEIDLTTTTRLCIAVDRAKFLDPGEQAIDPEPPRDDAEPPRP
jgi:hypothetical protein